MASPKLITKRWWLLLRAIIYFFAANEGRDPVLFFGFMLDQPLHFRQGSCGILVVIKGEANAKYDVPLEALASIRLEFCRIIVARQHQRGTPL